VSRILACAVLFAVASDAHAAEPLPRPPNILVLIADDLGWNDIGYHGSDIKTPVLDKLAADGVRLERYYVCPTCSPTRAGLLTGRNPSRFGILAPIADRSTAALPKDVPTLASVLKGRGYATALAGKWHLGLRPEVGPRQYGFEHTYGYLHGQIDPLTHRYKNGDRSWHRNDEFIDEKGHATDLLADEAVKFVGTKRAKPFFVWVAFSVPHHPLFEEEQWLNANKEIKDPWRRKYAASITHMDAAIGRIVEAVEKSGELERTLILFTSDNGGQKDYPAKGEYEGRYDAHTVLGDNKPWRGWKGELYEGGVRVPAFVHWRGRLKPGEVKAPISFLDWMPTFARLASATLAADGKLEGRDVWPLLSGEGKAERVPTLYWHTPRDRSVLVGDWKLIEPDKKPDAAELFNLGDDPLEKKNLVATNADKVAELRAILAEQKNRDPK
jgi:arylsulfatase A-like enzyme